MATKLKNINCKKGTRIIAFALAVIMLFVSGYFTSLFYREVFIYGSHTAETFAETPVFRNMLNSYERMLIHYGEETSATTVEEYKKTSEGKRIEADRQNQLKRVGECFDILDKSGVQVFITEDNKYRYKLEYKGYTYYFSYNGSIISAEEFNNYEYTYYDYADPEGNPYYDFTEAYVIYGDDTYAGMTSKVSSALSMLNSLSNTSCYGEISREDALKLVNTTYDTHLQNGFATRGVYTKLHQNTESINYAVFFKTTGNVITNCGVTRSDSHEAILGKIGGSFVECYENGKYSLLKGAPVKTEDSTVKNIRDEILGVNEEYSEIERYPDESVAKVYISYEKTGSDVFTVWDNLFNSFKKKAFVKTSLETMATVSVITFMLACAFGIYLICVAGKKEEGGVELIFIDKIPFAVNAVLGAGAMALCATAVIGGGYFEILPWEISGAPMTLVELIGKPITEWSALLFAIFFAVPTVILMSVARNIRNKSFWKNTLIYWILKPMRWIWGKIKAKAQKLRKILAVDYASDSRKFRKYALIAVSAVVLACLGSAFLAYAFGDAVGLLFLVVLFGICIGIVIYCVIHIVSLDKIMQAVSNSKNGKLDSKIDVQYMPGFMRNLAEDIGTMQDGLQEAVESAVKDQRMKAELITNVSHDLKTPLTSIVSYVDLLKRCEVENEDAKKYIDILDEKSQRMKKLIEDLVEASKASSGAIELHPVKINLCEFAAQAMGEHADELKKCGIEILIHTAQTPVFVTADAQKTSRIIENLFSNIRKYAMENTRVYVEVAGGSQYGSIILKNISKYPLNVEADELVQRFVRGDSSRTGEGSGLGLSIANNLCELQNGKFNVHVDGDLFKVTVALPIA